MNRVKALDLVGRVPEELWTEVCNTVQEAVTKTIPNKKKCKKVKYPTSAESQKKQGNFRKTFTSASLTMLNPLTMWITTNCGKFLKR